MAEHPRIHGVEVLMPAPEGYVVDFDNPIQIFALEHYLIFAFMGSLAFLALVQRLYTKIYLCNGLQIDDAFMLLAAMAGFSTEAILVYCVAIKTLGCHTWEIPLENYKVYIMLIYVVAGVFMLCNGFTKLSLLTFYLPISPQRWWRISVWIGIVIVALYTIVITTLLFVHCSPVQMAYDVDIKIGSCIDVGILYMATAVSNIITDVMLFVLPIPMVINLQMSPFQKFGTIVIFAIGSVTVATSVVRLVFLRSVLNTTDLPWDAASANIWSLIEGNLFVICASMPTLRKFFKHFAPRLMGTSEIAKSDYINQPSTGRSRRPVRDKYESFEDNEMQVIGSTETRDFEQLGNNHVHVEAGSEMMPDNGSEKAILQTRTITVHQT